MLTIPKEQNVDLLVTSPQGSPLMVVEVKRRSFDQSARQQLEFYSRTIGAEFVMGIDPHQILIAKTSDGSPDWANTIILSTKEILSRYDHESNLEAVEAFYLESLVEAWLRDFSFSWKSEKPPGHDQLDEIGLANRLKNSETHTQRNS